MMIWTSFAALASGICNAGLIAMVNRVLNGTGTPGAALVWAFVALGIGRLGSNFLAQFALAHFAQSATANLRRDLIRKILGVPLRQLEEVGTPRLMVTLTEDVTSITEAMLAIPTTAVNLSILLGGAVYLGWLSPMVLMAMFVFIVIGAVIYRLLIQSGFKQLLAARSEQDRLFRNFRSLTEGIKELKLHRERRGVFLSDNVQTTTEACRRWAVAAEVRFIIAQNWSQFLFFTLIGLILFLLPRIEHLDPHALTGYVVATLYLMGPLSGALGSLSIFGRASASLRKIEELGLALRVPAPDADTGSCRTAPASFDHLALVNVTHSYRRENEEKPFMIGPISLSFRTGELVYLVGGNGSGKSTLAKILTGLYVPEGGEIRVNGEIIDHRNRDDYRQHFSAVFADFHLFDSLIGLHSPTRDAQAREYLEQLHLDHKVSISNGRLSTTELSQGQRKRLALLTAYLEDRAFYLFDEWASDQDPLFKEVFYTRLLPDLKARGKTILVITHDDHYFHLADRVIKLDYGQIVSDAPGAEVGTETVDGGDILAEAKV
ncbi:MAG: cyclic peptide transporter [Rariglobus sp.]|nr:cyclic peptide transporter [Rariglobus sp.]